MLHTAWRGSATVVLDAEGHPHPAGELAAAVTQLQAQLVHQRTVRDWSCDQLRCAIAVRQAVITLLWALETENPAPSSEETP